jgi:hypothetical protein
MDEFSGPILVVTNPMTDQIEAVLVWSPFYEEWWLLGSETGLVRGLPKPNNYAPVKLTQKGIS